MPLDLTDDKSTLVQVVACCRQATSQYLSQCWLRFMSPYGVTRPQWVKLTKDMPYLNFTGELWDISSEWIGQNISQYNNRASFVQLDQRIRYKSTKIFPFALLSHYQHVDPCCCERPPVFRCPKIQRSLYTGFTLPVFWFSIDAVLTRGLWFFSVFVGSRSVLKWPETDYFIVLYCLCRFHKCKSCYSTLMDIRAMLDAKNTGLQAKMGNKVREIQLLLGSLD